MKKMILILPIVLLLYKCNANTDATIETKTETSLEKIEVECEDTSEVVRKIKKYDVLVPEGWTTYEIEDMFEISIPPTMELRHNSSLKVQSVGDKKTIHYSFGNYDWNVSSSIMFQKKGINEIEEKTGEMQMHKVLISLNIYRGNDGDYLRATEHQPLTKDFTETVKSTLFRNPNMVGMIPYISFGPQFSNIQIGKIFATQVKMVFDITDTDAKESNFILHSYGYDLCNYNKIVPIGIMYREGEGWDEDMNKVIKTFKWNKIK